MPTKSLSQNNHKKIKLLVICLLLLIGSFSISYYFFPTRETPSTVQEPSLIDILKSPSRDIFLQGIISNDSLSLANNLSLNKILSVKDNKTPKVILGKFQNWAQDAEVDMFFLSKAKSFKAIPLITWEPWSPEITSSEVQTNQLEYRLQNITDGKFDAYIRRYAIALKKFDYPVFLRFAHEMNGNWYPWSGTVNNNTPEAYKAAWQHIHDIFTQEKVTNVIWVWTPNEPFAGAFGKDSDQFSLYYPGDDYVDWVGVSAYNWGTHQEYSVNRSFSDVISSSYNILKSYGKPIMLAETNSVTVGVDKAGWIREMKSTLPLFPLIQGIVWYESSDGVFTIETELFFTD